MRRKIAPAEDGNETLSPVVCVENPASPGNSYSINDELPDGPKNCSFSSQTRSSECAALSVLVKLSVIQLM